jgi:argininosuccinate lyase
MKKKSKKTTVGKIDHDILNYTAGKDVELDHALIEADCLGTAAHVTMLSRMPVKPRLLSAADVNKIKRALQGIVAAAEKGKFKIRIEDQDVHLAVERALTKELGDLGKKVHTARSRNDQVAVDLRLFGREQIASTIAEAAALATALNKFAVKYVKVPMVGRTHMQPAMPSSVGLWATSYVESLLDDVQLLRCAADLNDQCPLGAAAGFGVPLPIDRALTAKLLGFSRVSENTLYASSHARGKIESITLDAVTQVMLSLSRLAQDLLLYTLPEFAYFTLPPEFGTGSSIMPNKNNPDVLELVRGKASSVQACSERVRGLLKAAPGGYNRDIQEAKEPFMEGLATTRHSLRVMTRCIDGLNNNRKALLDSFTPGVFATDRALELVGEGMPFRDAYHHVKEHLEELESMDPSAAIARKTHLGSTAGLNFDGYRQRIKAANAFARSELNAFEKVRQTLLPK